MKAVGTKADKKTYINAESTEYKKASGTELSCTMTCADDKKCEMMLMSGKKECHFFKDVSGVTKYKTPGGPGPSHGWWGREKSTILAFKKHMNDVKEAR